MSDRYSSRFRNFTCRDLRPMKNGEWLAYFLAVAEAPREPPSRGPRMSCETAQTTFSGEVERSSYGKSWRYVGAGS